MTGALPCRLGSAKVVRPSPPYVVPSSENSAWFWLMGRSCPLHIAQPLGAKLNDTILISPRNGVAAMVATPPVYGLDRRDGACAHHGRAGKTPCSAIQKLSTRLGIMLLCGRLLPATLVDSGLIATSGVTLL